MRKNTAPSRESTTESDSRPGIKPTKYANVTLHFAAPPTPPKQYQCLTSAKSVSLFNSGESAPEPERAYAARSRLSGARQKPSHNFLVRISPKSLVRIASTAMELVLLDRLFGECHDLLFSLSPILRKGHPLANDFSACPVVLNVRGPWLVLSVSFFSTKGEPTTGLPSFAGATLTETTGQAHASLPGSFLVVLPFDRTTHRTHLLHRAVTGFGHLLH